MKKTSLLLATAAIVLGLPACALQGTQRVTPTGIKLSNTVGLGTEAFIDEEQYVPPSNVTYNSTNNYYGGPRIIERTEHYCVAPREIILTPY